MSKSSMSTPNTAFPAITQEQMSSIKVDPTSNLLPSQEQLKSVSTLMVAAKVPAASVTTVALELVNFCYDNGSSAYTTVTGPSSIPEISLAQLASIVKASGTSLRKFCRYFAPIIWNLRTDKMAPANWEASGYKPSAKFAAFDFFDGVENPAAMQPPSGLIRSPTQEERIANATNKQVHLFQAAAQDNNFASNSAFITKGQISGSTPTIQFLPPPE
uniref:Coat protein n=1 Tax=Papaya mosaic potexvirus TaxID=12181 RepID=A2IAW7_PMV|nr:coat protein [Papaya mosaic virus]AFV46465.1 coat protein [Papaya mosaic virus]